MPTSQFPYDIPSDAARSVRRGDGTEHGLIESITGSGKTYG